VLLTIGSSDVLPDVKDTRSCGKRRCESWTRDV
jgi:hypothetical protein